MLMSRWEKKEGGKRRFCQNYREKRLNYKEVCLNYKDDSRTSREGLRNVLPAGCYPSNGGCAYWLFPVARAGCKPAAAASRVNAPALLVV